MFLFQYNFREPFHRLQIRIHQIHINGSEIQFVFFSIKKVSKTNDLIEEHCEKKWRIVLGCLTVNPYAASIKYFRNKARFNYSARYTSTLLYLASSISTFMIFTKRPFHPYLFFTYRTLFFIFVFFCVFCLSDISVVPRKIRDRTLNWKIALFSSSVQLLFVHKRATFFFYFVPQLLSKDFFRVYYW